MQLRPRPARIVPALLTTVAALALAAPAQAGTYTQYTCKLPDGSPAATDGWAPESAIRGFTQGDSCATGGYLYSQMDGVGVDSNSGRSWTWRTASAVQVTSARVMRAFSLAPGDDQVNPAMVMSSGLAFIEGYGSSATAGNGIAQRGNMNLWDWATNLVEITNPSTLSSGQVDLRLRCAGSNGRTCPSPEPSDLRIHAASFTLRDNASPAVSNVGGSLASSGDHSGVESLSFSATDTGAGVYRAIVEVDGSRHSSSIVDRNDGRCTDAVPATADPYEFQHRVPCKEQAGDTVSLDTRELRDGVHDLLVRVEDASGNSSPVFGPARIMVANGATRTPSRDGSSAVTSIPATSTTSTPTLNGIGGGAGARLIVLQRGSRSNTMRMRYGSRVTLARKLVDRHRRPIAGAVVDVLTQTRIGGARLVRQGTVTTGRDGVFRYVPPAGPSRLVRFAYRAHLEDTDYSETTDVRLSVKGRVTLRLSRSRLRNGQTLTYAGKLSGPHTGRRLVEVKVRSGSRWRVVCVARTDSKGAYRCQHRFTRTLRPYTYTFRTDVRRQVGMPYEPTTSGLRRASVRP
jgi:hypothetical protein